MQVQIFDYWHYTAGKVNASSQAHRYSMLPSRIVYLKVAFEQKTRPEINMDKFLCARLPFYLDRSNRFKADISKQAA